MWNKIKEYFISIENWGAILLGVFVAELSRQAGYELLGTILWVLAFVVVVTMIQHKHLKREVEEKQTSGDRPLTEGVLKGTSKPLSSASTRPAPPPAPTSPAAPR